MIPMLLLCVTCIEGLTHLHQRLMILMGELMLLLVSFMGELMLLLVFFVGELLLQLLPICMVVTLTLGEMTTQMMVLFLVLLQLVKFVVWLKIMSFYVPYV